MEPVCEQVNQTKPSRDLNKWELNQRSVTNTRPTTNQIEMIAAGGFQMVTLTTSTQDNSVASAVMTRIQDWKVALCQWTHGIKRGK